jgi:hypothetical protein
MLLVPHPMQTGCVFVDFNGMRLVLVAQLLSSHTNQPYLFILFH